MYGLGRAESSVSHWDLGETKIMMASSTADNTDSVGDTAGEDIYVALEVHYPRRR